MFYLALAAAFALFALAAWPPAAESVLSDRTGAAAEAARAFVVRHEAAVRAVAADPDKSGTFAAAVQAPLKPWRVLSCADGDGTVATYIDPAARAAFGKGAPLVPHIRRILARPAREYAYPFGASSPWPCPIDDSLALPKEVCAYGVPDAPGLGTVAGGKFVGRAGAKYVLSALPCAIADGSVVLVERAAW